jgi:hypothetical protein
MKMPAVEALAASKLRKANRNRGMCPGALEQLHFVRQQIRQANPELQTRHAFRSKSS